MQNIILLIVDKIQILYKYKCKKNHYMNNPYRLT